MRNQNSRALAIILFALAAGCQQQPPRCELCAARNAVLAECHHFANDPDGTPCSTTLCINNTLDSASCQSFPDRKGAPDCDTKVDRGGEVVQRIITADCPGGNVNFTPWQTIVSGCGTDCRSAVYEKACETELCEGPLLRGPFDRGVRKKCGC
jgi:hypothetical protein